MQNTALKNNGKETLEFYWIFPTDSFSEVEYFPTKQRVHRAFK